MFWSDWPSVLITLIVLLACYIYLNKKRVKRPENYPPGPKGVPLYGNILDLKKWDVTGPKILDDWAREFGKIYSIRLGVYDTIVLNTPEIVRQVFVTNADKSSGRAINVFFFSKIISEKIGIIFNEGEEWRHNRRAALHAMRDFGMGKKSLDYKIQEEAVAAIEMVGKLEGQAFNPKYMLNNIFSNIISSVLFGDRYEQDDPDFLYFCDNMNTLFSGGGFKNPEIFIPILTPLIPVFNPSLFWVTLARYRITKFLKKRIDAHRESFNPDDISCFADVYLKAALDGDLQDKTAERNLLISIEDILIAGSETTSTTVRWVLLHLINHPQVQQKCQQEIKEVIGQIRAPTRDDQIRLPYTEATLLEVQRMSSVAAYSVLHRAEDDFEVEGYAIPKDTLLLTNIHYIHMDPANWGDPENFRPERWIGSDGSITKPEAFMPFLMGPRQCMGKLLATQGIFIVVVSLLQKFRFSAVDVNNPPPIAGAMGIVYTPNDFDIKVDKL